MCFNFSNISVKRNNIDTNKLITINYQQSSLYSERKVDDLVGYEMQCFSHHGIPLSVIREKNLNFQVHQDIKLNAGL